MFKIIDLRQFQNKLSNSLLFKLTSKLTLLRQLVPPSFNLIRLRQIKLKQSYSSQRESLAFNFIFLNNKNTIEKVTRQKK